MLLRFVLAGLIITSVSARADEQMRKLAASGNWLAMAHSPSMTAPDDVCLLASPAGGGAIALRFGENHVEFRVSNTSWALPASIEGAVSISINQLNRTFPIADNTDQSVTTIVPDEDLAGLFAAMDKGSAMAVTVGKAKPITVSLAGSTRATNAFRTCAHIQGAPSQSGSNPFQ